MEMAEGPALSERARLLKWQVIQGTNWAPRRLCEVDAKYRGDRNNQGRLSKRNGIGEYLDVKAITLAKKDVEPEVKREMPTYDMPAKLPIKHLRLSGFVVDGKLVLVLVLRVFANRTEPKHSPSKTASMKTYSDRSTLAGTVWMQVLG